MTYPVLIIEEGCFSKHPASFFRQSQIAAPARGGSLAAVACFLDRDRQPCPVIAGAPVPHAHAVPLLFPARRTGLAVRRWHERSVPRGSGSERQAPGGRCGLRSPPQMIDQAGYLRWTLLRRRPAPPKRMQRRYVR